MGVDPVAQRTIVTFASKRFNETLPQSHFINRHCYGDDLARSMIGVLRATGTATDDLPTQEDFGWWFRFQGGTHPHCFIVGYRPPDDGNNDEGLWIGSVERDRGLLGSIIGKRKTGIELVAVRSIHTVLVALELRNIMWHRESVFDRSEDEGSREPE